MTSIPYLTKPMTQQEIFNANSPRLAQFYEMKEDAVATVFSEFDCIVNNRSRIYQVFEVDPIEDTVSVRGRDASFEIDRFGFMEVFVSLKVINLMASKKIIKSNA